MCAEVSCEDCVIGCFYILQKKITDGGGGVKSAFFIMNFADNEMIRLHLNLEPEDVDQDMETRFAQYSQAAIEYIKVKLNCNLYAESVPEDESRGRVITSDMVQAELMLIEEFFRHRGTSSSALSRETAITVDKILNKRRFFNV